MTHSPEDEDPATSGGDPGGVELEDEDTPEDAELRARVEEALDLTRALLTPEELDEQRRMLFSLARTHPRLSRWLSDQRPREAPDRSGVVQKKDEAALEASVARRAGGRGKGA